MVFRNIAKLYGEYLNNLTVRKCFATFATDAKRYKKKCFCTVTYVKKKITGNTVNLVNNVLPKVDKLA